MYHIQTLPIPPISQNIFVPLGFTLKSWAFVVKVTFTETAELLLNDKLCNGFTVKHVKMTRRSSSYHKCFKLCLNPEKCAILFTCYLLGIYQIIPHDCIPVTEHNVNKRSINCHICEHFCYLSHVGSQATSQQPRLHLLFALFRLRDPKW